MEQIEKKVEENINKFKLLEKKKSLISWIPLIVCFALFFIWMFWSAYTAPPVKNIYIVETPLLKFNCSTQEKIINSWEYDRFNTYIGEYGCSLIGSDKNNTRLFLIDSKPNISETFWNEVNLYTIIATKKSWED